MQIELVVMLILTSSTQVRGDQKWRPEPLPARNVVVTVRFANRGGSHELTFEMPAPDAPNGEDDDPPPARPVGQFDIRTAALQRDNFDRWLFPRDESELARRVHLQVFLDAKVALAAKAHKLTGPQRAKLGLAGRGDIKRFFDEVQKRRDEFETDRKDFNTGLAALRRLDELSPSYKEGPFGSGSLFAKTLHKINNERKAGD